MRMGRKSDMQKDLWSAPCAKFGRGPDGESKAGREASTTGAQRREVGNDAEVGLWVILEVWPGLPEPARRAVVAILRSLRSRCPRV